MLDLRRFEEAVIHSVHSLYFKQMLNSWATQNRIIPQDWKDLVTAILETGPLLQWKTWWREETRVMEQWNGAKISQEQFLGKGQYADLQRHLGFDDHILALCHLAALIAWNRIEESEKMSELFTKIIQCPKEAFTDFLQSLISVVNRMYQIQKLNKY